MLPTFPPARETMPITMLMIDRMTVTVHAQPLPLSRPYATTNETIPKTIKIPPTITPAPPASAVRAICPAMFGLTFDRVGSSEPAAARPTPAKSMTMPPMIFSMAMTVTPSGLEVTDGFVTTYQKQNIEEIFKLDIVEAFQGFQVLQLSLRYKRHDLTLVESLWNSSTVVIRGMAIIETFLFSTTTTWDSGHSIRRCLTLS